jgi:SAM-dependent methyltransferase
MRDHWQQLLKQLDYQPGEKILDVGGAMDPIPIADVIIDAFDFGLGGKSYTLLDLSCDTIPFPDKYFDICICSQTLEDLTSPRLIIREMSRVAKRGIIEVPHRGSESLRVSQNHIVQKPNYSSDVDVWCYGTEHHKWLIEVVNHELFFTVKNMIYLMMHPIPQWRGQGGIRFQWANSIPYKIMYDIDPRSMHRNYHDFRERNRQYWE